MNVDQLHQLQMQRLADSFGLANTMSAVRDDRAARALGNHYSEERNNNQNIRTVNVGMFSGPRPTYQRYNLSQNAFGALDRTGA